MTSTPESDSTHEETRDLIPWWVNGRLSDAEARQVEAHLATCAACRADAEVERRVLAAVRHKSQVAYAPQVSLQKLMARIEDVERDVPTRPAPSRSVPAAPRPASVLALASGPRWRLAAGMALGLGLGVLASGGWQAAVTGGPAAYSTVTTPQTAVGRAAQIRVVFSPTATVDELVKVVAGNGLAIVDGPSGSGVYGLALASGSEVTVPAALARLRADPRVRFAEPLEAAAAITEP